MSLRPRPQRHHPLLGLIVVALALWQLMSSASAADSVLSPAALAVRGIDMQLFSMVTLSHDGSVLLGVEKVRDLGTKQQGIASQLRVFYWRGVQCTRMDTIPLPTTAFEQLALSPDGRSALVIGEGGSKFILVDVPGRRTRILWSHRRGTRGFRSSLVAWWQGSGFHLLGYLHNPLDQLTYEGIVRLETDREGPEMFQPALDIRPIIRQLKAISFATYVDPAQGFFGVMPRPGRVEIHAWNSGTLSKIDEVTAVGGIASARNRILYAARFDDGRRDVLLRDVSTQKTWRLGRDNLPFNYLFLSTSGRTAILTLMDFRAQVMSYFCATEADGFRTRPVGRLQGVRPGTLRLSGDGRVYAYYGPVGLIYGQLP